MILTMANPDLSVVVVPFELDQKDGDQMMGEKGYLYSTHRGNLGLPRPGVEAGKMIPRPERYSD